MASTSSITPSDSISVASGSANTATATPSRATAATIPGVKKQNKRIAHPVWAHARTAITGVEPRLVRSGKSTRSYWYCIHTSCVDYSTLSTVTATLHMASHHGIVVDEPQPSKLAQKIQKDIDSFITPMETVRRSQEDALIKGGLKAAANPVTIKQALLRLIVHHDLPLSFVEWPETHTFVNAINYQATGILWTSHQATATRVSQTFKLRQEQIKRRLQQSQSLIHLTTDTWHSPNHKEFQSITAHFVDDENRLQKALLALPELDNGHSGVEVAPHIIKVLEQYEIKERVGYITTDNATANDTLCHELGEFLTNWKPRERRLRCIGHIINLAVQSFFFAKDQEAVELAEEDAYANEQLQETSDNNLTGWIQQPALQKILHLIITLQRSDRLFNSWKKHAGKAIRRPVVTRWNSYYTSFEDALELRHAYTTFVLDHNEQLGDYELSANDWQLVEQTIAFLRPFKQATLQCEGDHVTLDKVQSHMDMLRAHFIKQRAVYQATSNKAFYEAIITGWYAFDKYYSWIDQTGACSVAILLNPRLRKSYLAAAWQRDWVKPGIERARAVWTSQYKKEPDTVTTTVTEPVVMTAYEEFMSSIATKQHLRKGTAIDEFDRFIEANAEPVEGSPLQWWLQPLQQRTYPQLAKMAIDVLSAPAMSAEDERVFSGARRTITWTRAKLEGPMIEQLECVKHWQRTGLVDEQFIEPEDEGIDEVGGSNEVL
jgi:hypothetical protein